MDDPTFEDQLNITVPEDRPQPVVAAPPSMLDLTLVAARDLLLFGWGLGLLACFVISWRKWSDFKYDILQSQVETPAWFEALVAQVADSVQIHRRIKIVVTEHPAGPLMMGTWRPTLVIPSSLLHEETSHRLRPIVAHELVHARRADTVIGWLQTIAQWIWWFHPLVWWANRQTTRFCETSCDDEVIARLNCRPRFYAACLLDLLEGRRIPEQSRVALSGIRLAAITRQRLDELIHRPKSRRAGTPVWGWTVALLIAVLALPGAERLSRADQVRDIKLDLADQPVTIVSGPSGHKSVASPSLPLDGQFGPGR